MRSVHQVMEEHRESLRKGVIPRVGPSVLVEAARPDEELLPRGGPEQVSKTWGTQVIELDAAGIQDQQSVRVEEMMSLQDLVSDDSQIFPIRKQRRNSSPNVCIGRARRNDIVVADSAVSSLHAVIEDAGDRHYLRDHGSSNGTFVNTRCLEPTSSAILRSGDCVRFGNRVFYYLTGDRLSLFLELRINL